MIKDKIDLRLKKAFSDSIEKTKNTQNEHGFLLCSNDHISPSEVKFEGSTFGITFLTKPGLCPGKIQGFFHAHPHKSLFDLLLGRDVSYEEIAKMKKMNTKNGITIQTPSHKDVLMAFISKCEKLTVGTICTSSDIGTDKVECWTPKKNAANLVTCNIAKIDNKYTKEMTGNPKRWIRPLFEKETILLK